MRIVCQQTILMNYHALFVNLKKSSLTLKAPITTAADDIFFVIFPKFRKKIRDDIS